MEYGGGVIAEFLDGGYSTYETYLAAKAEKATNEKAEAKRKYEESVRGFTFEAVLGCKDNFGQILFLMLCADSAKVNGRYLYTTTMEYINKYKAEGGIDGVSARKTIKILLEKAFHLEVKGKKKNSNYKYTVRIFEISTGKEVFYEEKIQDQWGHGSIKVENK